MTFNMRPVTQGYGNIASRQFGTELNKVPRWKHEMHTRFAMDALGEKAENMIAENQRKMQELGMQSQEGFPWEEALGIGKSLIGAFSGGGSGGSGGISFSDGMNLGLPSYGDYKGIPSGGFGAFSGGGGGISFSDGMNLGLPSYGDYTGGFGAFG